MDDELELILYETDFERAAIVGYQLCEQFGIDPENAHVIITINVDGNK